MLPARMRSSAGWSDACILNVSTGGLMVYTPIAIEPGATVELRRGGNLVIARVAWRENCRIGLASHAPIRIEDIISVETASATLPAMAIGVRVERRRKPRAPDQSRHRARAMEFLSLAALGAGLAGIAGFYVAEALAKPIFAVSAALATR